MRVKCITLGPLYSRLKLEKGCLLHTILLSCSVKFRRIWRLHLSPARALIGQLLLPGVWVQRVMAYKAHICSCWLDSQSSRCDFVDVEMLFVFSRFSVFLLLKENLSELIELLCCYRYEDKYAHNHIKEVSHGELQHWSKLWLKSGLFFFLGLFLDNLFWCGISCFFLNSLPNVSEFNVNQIIFEMYCLFLKNNSKPNHLQVEFLPEYEQNSCPVMCMCLSAKVLRLTFRTGFLCCVCI